MKLVIYVIVILFISTSAFQTAQGQEPFSLFENQDFIPLPKKNEGKLDQKNINNLPPSEIRKRLLASFHFISDFESQTRRDQPLNWVDSKSNPQKTLEIGYPQSINRPKYEIRFPIYPLTKLYYFKGNNIVNSSINACQSYWQQGRLQETLDCFAILQNKVSRGIYDATPIQKMQLFMLDAFLMLQLAIENHADIYSLNFSTDPPGKFKYREFDALNITKDLFYYTSTRFNEDMFLPKNKSSNIISNYGSFFDYPYYLIDNVFIGNKVFKVTIDDESIDALTWIRSVLPVLYFNTMSVHNTIGAIPKAFDAIDKITHYFNWFKFLDEKQLNGIEIRNIPNIENDIFLKPSNNNDLLVVTDLFKALVLQKAKEPDTALKYIAQGILRKGDPNLASLLFKLSGDSYYDFGILNLARTSYSWSEMYSKDFVYKVPSALFFGAESAFWLGHFKTAKQGFEKFLLTSGDKAYAPKAKLRLALIEQYFGNNEKAKSLYEYIVRNLDNTPESQDATVNLFCMNVDTLTPRVRDLEYNKVIEKIESSRTDLKRQAKACLLKSNLIASSASSIKDDSKNVVEKANIQQKLIDKYKEEFPDNEFLVLFADRIRFLKLSEAPFLAAQNKCNEFISYYKKNKNELNYLSLNNNKYLKGLKWTINERRKLLRCSALIGNIEIWKEARKLDAGKDGHPLQNKFYELYTKPSAYNALELYLELKKIAPRWTSKISKIESSNMEIIGWKDFWEMLSLRYFLDFDLSANESTKKLLANSIVKDLVKSPKLIFEYPLFCHWFLREMNKLKSSDLDAIATLKSTEDWLAIISTKDDGRKCEISVASNLISLSEKNPSEKRDKRLLLPYLEKKGLGEASEEWLTFVKRLEQERGSKDKEVIEIYRKLSKEAKDPLVKDTSSLWLKKNFPTSSDRILW